MRRIDALVLALLIGIAAVLGTFAATRSVQLGVQSRASTTQNIDAVVTARTRKLHADEAALRRALAKKPPALPPLASTTTSRQTGTIRTQTAAVTLRTVSPSTTRATGKHESEQESELYAEEVERDD
jgi:hypothetical protein